MSVQLAPPRPRKSVGAASVGVLVTLLVFVLVFMAFLIAPLLALPLAYVAYLALRPREKSSAPSAQATHGFGAGAR